MPFPWKKYEAALLRGAESALREIMDQQAETFYAFAFHEFYAETEGPISLPWLGTNSLEGLASSSTSKWSEPDWKWPNLEYANDELKTLHAELEKIAGDLEEEDWNELHDRFLTAYVSCTKKLAGTFKKHPRAAADFIGIVQTEDDEVEVLQRCVTPAQFQKHFPWIVAQLEEARKTSAGTIEQQLAKYGENLYRHEAELTAIGAPAIPLLLEKLSDPKQEWAAAHLLGRIQIAEPRVMAAHRQRASALPVANPNVTCALALLGDVDFLLQLAETEVTRAIAIRGIQDRYSAAATEVKLKLDYRPLERLLVQLGCENLPASGGGAMEIGVDDVPEALRGLQSPHIPIREHAVCALGERRLGAKAGKQILPAVALLLADPVPNVRRLASLSLGYWKKAALPYKPAIEALFADPDAKVAEFARYVIQEMK